jgi:hypothetical protein
MSRLTRVLPSTRRGRAQPATRSELCLPRVRSAFYLVPFSQGAATTDGDVSVG